MNYKTAFEHFEAFVNERVENFSIDSPELASFVQNVLNYFTEGQTNLNRDKGLLIRGAIGSGKTFTMKVIQKWLSEQKKFSFYRCQNIAEDFNKAGSNVLVEYNIEKEILFDDLGAEEQGRFYGDKQEVFEKIILHITGMTFTPQQATGRTSQLTLAMNSCKKNTGRGLMIG
jgi:DNA replication protein DnaC